MFKRIIAFVIVLSSLLFLVLPVFADDTVAHSVVVVDDFWDYVGWSTYNAGNALQENLGGLAGWVLGRPFEIIGASISDDDICIYGDGGKHHSSQYNASLGGGQDDHGYYRLFQCDDCGVTFKAYGDQFKDAYSDYVESLPGSGYSSTGAFLWYPTFDDVDLTYTSGGYVIRGSGGSGISSFYYNGDCHLPFHYYYDGDLIDFNYYLEDNRTIGFSIERGTWYYIYGGFKLNFFVPVAGSYTILPTSAVSCTVKTLNDGVVSLTGSYSSNSYSINTNISQSYTFSRASSVTAVGLFYLPVYEVVPSTSNYNGTSFTTIYAPTSRINNTSFTLATTENNEITNVYEDVTIFNEGDSILYNPVTNTTYEVNNWNYDYRTRSYSGELNVDPEIDVSGKLNFIVAYLDDLVKLKIGDVEIELNYAVEQEPEPTPTPVPTPINTPLPGDGGDSDTDDTPYWLWLMDWLDNFKAWLGAKLDSLKGNDVTVNNSYTDNSETITNIYDYEITYENPEGEEESISAKKFINKFAWIKSVFNIGKSLVSVVSSDAAAAYDLDLSGLDSGSAAGDPGSSGSDSSGTVSNVEMIIGEYEEAAFSGGSAAPSIVVHLGAANSHYGFNYGGDVAVLDLSWYTPYKSTVDGILSGFLWVFFCWKLFQKLPGIISGSSMDSSKLESISKDERSKQK